MNYDIFDRETKNFFNKAMDIYSTIKENDINQVVSEYGSPINYQFSKLDKKICLLCNKVLMELFEIFIVVFTNINRHIFNTNISCF